MLRAVLAEDRCSRGVAAAARAVRGRGVRARRAAVGGDAARSWAAEVHRRSGGHPFFARQLAELLADPAQPAGAVPAGVHDLVARRVERLSSGCRELVKAAAVAGTELYPTCLPRYAAST